MRSLMIIALLLGGAIGALLAGEGQPDGAGDPLARLMLAYTRERAARVDDAEVVISSPVSQAHLDQLGMPKQPAAGSSHGLYLVVIRGDLDVAGVMPGWGRWSGSQPAAYIAYIFDTVRTPDGRLEMGSHFLTARASDDPGWPDWAREQLSAAP